MRIAAALLTVFAAGATFVSPSPAADSSARPAILLVHGAFAESASWDAVSTRLSRRGYQVIAVANPLRGVAADAAYLSSLVASVDGPVVLVGHSYGGAVITVAGSAPNVRSLVYVAGLAPDAGESASVILERFPGSTLGPALRPVDLAGGGKDLYVDRSRFREQFGADVSDGQSAAWATNQRPILAAAFDDKATAAAWRRKPSWFVFGELDRNIPAAAHRFMAQRARARETVEIRGASHMPMVSQAEAVAATIERAAASP